MFDDYSNNVAVYGLGTETERFLSENSNKLTIVGLLDGFKSDGELYGYPIIPISESLTKGVKLIIVVARPGSCKAIAKKIGEFCRENDIALFDVRGRNLLDAVTVEFDFKNINGSSKDELMDKASFADVISFDLFDTLVMRKVKTYTDVFDILDQQLRVNGFFISDFAKKRIFAEKELSKGKPPKLEQIYDYFLDVIDDGGHITPNELANLEWQLDFSLLITRRKVKEIFDSFLSMGKKVVITTDCYYSKEQIVQLLDRYGFSGYDELLVSCEYGTAKTQNLFSVLSDKYRGKKILHIGDDEFADIEKANSFGIDTFRIYSADDLFDALGGLGVEDAIVSITDNVKIGLFLSHLFNNPFWFEDEKRRLSVNTASEIGYLFSGAMITDFTIWMKERAQQQGYEQILFGARDGYLVDKLFKILSNSGKSYYFLCSRTAAIRAGMDFQEDIDYVGSMNYFGTPEEALKRRFGIEVDDVNSVDCDAMILEKTKQQRENYHKYINKLGIGSGKLAFFDFVAKGTTQMYLRKLFVQQMKGFYFLQLEREFMKDKGLDIESFYSDEEKNTSAIFDNYYILETVLTSPDPQLLEFDLDGNPIYADETRSDEDIATIKLVQSGIVDYFKDYLRLVPESQRKVNKALDEKLLELINHIKIEDDDFMNLKVEDPFFGRMTDIRNVIG